ncbi:hypothetical protein RZS08_30825, partial [Arthrospira platensis SPKY1]|nr:hypothetical protein [Arthrospira platensis SPKY1]
FQSNPKDNFNGDNIRLKIEPFMEFMGWFLSEGSSIIHKTKKGCVYRISIFQCESANKEKFERIGDCLRELGYKPYKNKNGWHFTDKYLALYLSQFGKSYQKYIPNNLKQLDPSLLSIMIESLLLGDGNKNGENGHTYSSTSRRLASDFQEISIKCGYRTSMSMENRIGK